VPEEIRSKIFAVHVALTNAFFLISLLLVGIVVKLVPVRFALFGFGIASLLVFCIVFLSAHRWGYHVTRAVLIAVMKYWFKFKVSGLENIPRSRRVILAGNHTSLIDGAAVMCAYPGRVYFLAADTLFKTMPWKWIVRFMDLIPIRRGGFNKESIQRAVAVLKSGYTIGIFPEGKITQDGRLTDGKEGVVMIAQLADADIIPFAIEGAFEAWPVPKRLPRAFPIEVRFGPKIDISAYETKQNALDDVMQGIAQVKLSLERDGYLRVDPDDIIRHLINVR
jgi:1-acyl-sn-glycerol-3-phosphate acyltransferase